MTKRYFYFIILTLCLLACEKAPENIPVTSVSLSQPTAEMIEGETIQLLATVLPSDATNKTVTWASSKQSVATVSNSGVVTAIAEGTSTITASAEGKSASCKIVVQKKVIPVSSVTLNRSSLTLTKGQSETLTATVNPADATNKAVTWSSSDSSVASVDQNGKVTAANSGTATITATSGDKSATCKVTVTIPVESINLDPTSITCVEGETITIKATVNPSDATDKTVTWSSSDANVATVDQSGTVVAIKEGSTTITASSGGKSASCTIKVNKNVIAVTAVTLNKPTLELAEGDTETLVATVKPDDATDKTVTWASSNQAVATVDNGLVTAIKEGIATISVTSGEVSTSCEVKVITHMDAAISFADSGIKNCLVNAFDTNNDGKLSFREAAAVTSIEGVFGTNRSFTSFDEFQYFTGVTTIPGSTFSSWKMLKSIVLPISISYIAGLAFNNCESLSSIIIPNAVTTIGVSAFYECKSLASVSLPESLVNLEKKAFYRCESLVSIEIPDNVTVIADNCFDGCMNLSSVKLPALLRSIGSQAFSNCAITSISLPERIKSIGFLAFSSCVKLSAIEIPDGVTSLYSAFYNCTSLVTVTLPETITHLNNSFTGCASLTTIELPKGIKSLHGAFDGCSSLTTISIPNSVTDIAEAFRNCSSLTSVEISDGGYEYINFSGSFSGCTSLTSVKLPKKVRELNGTFSDCTSLTSVTISESVNKIGENAFANCVKLSSIDIPKTVSSVGYRAFINCSSLQEVIINSTSVPSGDYDMFLGSTCPIYVPSESVEAYKTAQYWVDYADRIQAIKE